MDDDNLSIDEALDILIMKKKYQQLKKKHSYEIHHTDKSGYFTVVDDESASGGKRKIRRATEESLLEALASWYFDNDKRNISLADLYTKWLEWKKTPSNSDNIRRIKASWKAYYENEPLSTDIIINRSPA